MNIKDLQNDFATDEFITKNVRVRPTSSHSVGKGGREESEAAHRGGFAGPNSVDEDPEDKYNVEQLLELNSIRQERKDRRKKE
jgi:hypothetical protein